MIHQGLDRDDNEESIIMAWLLSINITDMNNFKLKIILIPQRSKSNCQSHSCITEIVFLLKF